jgi:hypothetical protein
MPLPLPPPTLAAMGLIPLLPFAQPRGVAGGTSCGAAPLPAVAGAARVTHSTEPVQLVLPGPVPLWKRSQGPANACVSATRLEGT